MIIDNFDLMGIPISPNKTQPPLFIDANTVLSLAPAFQKLKKIGRWNPQVANSDGIIQHTQLSSRNILYA